jgi:hypothetical protein
MSATSMNAFNIDHSHFHLPELQTKRKLHVDYLDKIILDISRLQLQQGQSLASHEASVHFAARIAKDPAVLAILEKNLYLFAYDHEALSSFHQQLESKLAENFSQVYGNDTQKSREKAKHVVKDIFKSLVNDGIVDILKVQTRALKEAIGALYDDYSCSQASGSPLSTKTAHEVKQQLTALVSICEKSNRRMNDYKQGLDELINQILHYANDYSHQFNSKKSEEIVKLVQADWPNEFKSMPTINHPLAELWIKHSIGSAKLSDKESIHDDFIKSLAQGLREKNYSKKDAIREAEHLYECLISSLDNEAVNSYVNTYLFSINLYEHELELFNRTKALKNKERFELVIGQPQINQHERFCFDNHRRNLEKKYQSSRDQVQEIVSYLQTNHKTVSPQAALLEFASHKDFIKDLYERALFSSYSSSPSAAEIKSSVEEFPKTLFSTSLKRLFIRQKAEYDAAGAFKRIALLSEHQSDPDFRLENWINEFSERYFEMLDEEYHFDKMALAARRKSFGHLHDVAPHSLNSAQVDLVACRKEAQAQEDYAKQISSLEHSILAQLRSLGGKKAKVDDLSLLVSSEQVSRLMHCYYMQQMKGNDRFSFQLDLHQSLKNILLQNHFYRSREGKEKLLITVEKLSEALLEKISSLQQKDIIAAASEAKGSVWQPSKNTLESYQQYLKAIKSS